MVKQFAQKAKKRPKAIVLTPLALLAMAMKKSAQPSFEGIPVICREADAVEATDNMDDAVSLAIFVMPEGKSGRLVSCAIKA